MRGQPNVVGLAVALGATSTSRDAKAAPLNVSVDASIHLVDGVGRSAKIAGTLSPSTARTTTYIESALLAPVMPVCVSLCFFDSICNHSCHAATHNLEDPFPAGQSVHSTRFPWSASAQIVGGTYRYLTVTVYLDTRITDPSQADY
jgi:hypothetical protein